MEKHWSHKYLMTPFKPFGCGEFVEKILIEQFKINFELPKSTGSLKKDPEIIRGYCNSVLKKTESPREGDIAVMGGARESCHVGVVVKIKDSIAILHTDRKMKVASINSVERLHFLGYFLEGFYTWQK